jgi:putative peptidoglycan lipid II flippase
MSLFRSILTVGGMTVISRISGFVRDTLAANMIGAGPVSDAFFVALRLPSLFRSLFAEGAFSAAFVPLYAKARQEGGQVEATRFAGEAMSALFAVLAPFVALIILFMPQAIGVLAPGFGDAPEVLQRAITYSRITFPYLLLISIVALLAGVLNSNRKFAPGAAAPIAFNLFMIVALLLSARTGGEPGIYMAVAVTLSGVAQWLWMLQHCRAMGIAPSALWPRFTPRVKELFGRMGPGALGAGAAQINIALSTVLASLLPTGSVSYLFYADRLNQLPLGIIGIALATTLLPFLSSRVQAGDTGGMRHAITRSLEFGLILGLPAAIGLGIAAHEIVRVLFQHGAFTAQDTANTSAALTAYVAGIVPFILIKIFAAISFAHHDTKTPVRTALIAVAVNIIAALLLIRPLGFVGIALATAIATWVNLILLMVSLHRKNLLLIDPSAMPRLVKIALAAAVMAGLLLLGQGPVEGMLDHAGKGLEVLILAGYLGGALLIYLLGLALTKAVTKQELVALLKKET